MKNKVKSTFRNSLIVGLIPIGVIAIITGFVIWGLSVKNNKDVDYSVDKPEVIHDTVYVKVPCNKNHFECPPVETKKRKVSVEVPTEINPEVNQDTSK